jgi:hypothetical protein
LDISFFVRPDASANVRPLFLTLGYVQNATTRCHSLRCNPIISSNAELVRESLASGASDDNTLNALVAMAIKYDVKLLLREPNYCRRMFTRLLIPTVAEVRHGSKGQHASRAHGGRSREIPMAPSRRPIQVRLMMRMDPRDAWVMVKLQFEGS